MAVPLGLALALILTEEIAAANPSALRRAFLSSISEHPLIGCKHVRALLAA